jgi:hypothetical protein
MFPPSTYTRAWADEKRRELGNCDPVLLEKCVHALTLLGLLAESGLPFIFKGGTSLLLHLPQISRLSIDIDIVSPATDDELNRVVQKIGKLTPFIRAVESERDKNSERESLPRRRHFKFFFRSERAKDGEAAVLLDVVQEKECPHVTVQRPIRTSFLVPEREIAVTLPTIESLLGDKLTAFAPTTTGVRLRRSNGSPGDVMQVAKQLFDVGVLFAHAANFAEITRVYDGVQAQEASYRGNAHTREETLTDTLNACLGATALKPAHYAVFPDTPLLLDGFNKLRGHLTDPKFDTEKRRVLAARAGLLAAYLQSGRSLDLETIRYTQSEMQLDNLRAASLRGHPHDWLDRIKPTNPEAYHYWHIALTP